MAYVLKTQKHEGFAPNYKHAHNFADAVEAGIEALESGVELVGVAHGAEDYPLKADDIRGIMATRAEWVRMYAAAGVTLRYPLSAPMPVLR